MSAICTGYYEGAENSVCVTSAREPRKIPGLFREKQIQVQFMELSEDFIRQNIYSLTTRSDYINTQFRRQASNSQFINKDFIKLNKELQYIQTIIGSLAKIQKLYNTEK
jgi:hypothetical protein